MPIKDILLILLAISTLGLNFSFIKFGLLDYPPIFLNFLRYFFSAFPLVFFIPRPNVPMKKIVSFGLIWGFLQFSLLFSAIKFGMPGGLSSLLMQMQVFFTILLAFFFFNERPSLWQIAGALLAFSGIGVLLALKAHGVTPFLLGMVILAAFSWGVANTIVKTLGKIDMLPLVIWGSLAATPPLLLLSLLLEDHAHMWHSLLHPTLLGVFSLIFQSYATTILAFTIWNKMLSRYPAALVTPFALLIPIAGIGSTHLFFNEPFGMPETLASLLVFAGLAINLWGSARKNAAARKISSP